MSKGNRFDNEFKQMIVGLYNSGKSISELTSEYGVSKATVYKWVNLYSPIEIPDGEVTTNAEILKLKKQLAEAQEELEILKKAVAIFTKK